MSSRPRSNVNSSSPRTRRHGSPNGHRSNCRPTLMPRRGKAGSIAVASLYLSRLNWTSITAEARSAAPTIAYEDITRRRICSWDGNARSRAASASAGRLSSLTNCPGSSPRSAPPTGPGCCFARRIELRGLVPTSLVSYRRVAGVGEDTYGPIRLTIDRDFLCRTCRRDPCPKLSGGPPVFAGLGVVELKYRTAMPSLFKTLIAEQRTRPGQGFQVSRGRPGVRVVSRRRKGQRMPDWLTAPPSSGPMDCPS